MTARLQASMIATAIAFAICLSLAPDSNATTLVTPAGAVAQPYQGWADRFKVPTVPGTIVIDSDASGCPLERTACTIPGRIFMAAGTPLEDEAHELGHQFEYAMPEWKRQRFLRIMGETRPWRSPPNSPHEQWAVAYALCATGATHPGKRDSWGDVTEYGYGFAPRSPRQYQRICHLIRIPQ